MPSNKAAPKPYTVPFTAQHVFAGGKAGWAQATKALLAFAGSPLGNKQYSGQGLCVAVFGPCANLKVNKRVCRWVRQQYRSNGQGVGQGSTYSLSARQWVSATKANAAQQQASAGAALTGATATPTK